MRYLVSSYESCLAKTFNESLSNADGRGTGNKMAFNIVRENNVAITLTS